MIYLVLILVIPVITYADNQTNADIVLLNGSVYTVEYGTDWPFSPEEAIAMKGDSIQAINTTSAIKQYIGPKTQVYDLRGKMVLPGFIDTHIHLGLAAQLMAGVDLQACTSIPEIQKNLSAYAAQHKDMPVIRGFGWKYFQFNESGPNKAMIDAVIADKPVILTSFDGHSIWVNSKSLDIAGISGATPDPKGGRIEKDVENNPTGVLHELSASNLVINKVPPLSSTQIKEMLKKILPKAAAYGITTADDAAVTPEVIAAFSDLEDEGNLPVRIFGEIVAIPELGEAEIPAMVAVSTMDYPDLLGSGSDRYEDDLLGALGNDTEEYTPVQSFPNYSDTTGLFRLETGKLFLDGVIEGHTGYLLEPYADQPSINGTINWDPATFTQMIEDLDRLGFQVDVHAIGDGAVRMTLDAYENAREKNGVRDSRHKLSHIQLIDPSDIPRIQSEGIIAALQPNWFYYDKNFQNVSLPYLGDERANRMYTLKSILNSGGIVAFGTDFPLGTDYLTYNPLDGIRTAVTRLPLPPDSSVHTPYRPEELIDLKTALESATYWGAYTNFMENNTGSLKEGKKADIIVLDQDLFTIPLEEINKVQVVATYLEGKEVYASPSFSPS
ncbi:MAG TPA: amidohydrolase family protein [Methanospirillum sp.]|nr:amidohydrolase family protein [Methanospirillum sp.]